MAGRLILATVGTSALDRRKLEMLSLWGSYQSIRMELSSATPQKFHLWVEEKHLPRPIDQFMASYADALYRLDIAEAINQPYRGVIPFSAEMTSLYLMYQNAEQDPDLQDLDPKTDTIVFVLSDSAEGALCGLLHRKWLSESRFLREQNIEPTLRIIDDLQVENLPKFLQNGLQKFTAALREYTRGQPRSTLFNATGGFKSLIPYATFLSLAYTMPMFFVFEELPHLLAIKPPPIQSQDDKARLLGFVQQIFRRSSVHLEFTPSDA